MNVQAIPGISGDLILQEPLGTSGEFEIVTVSVYMLMKTRRWLSTYWSVTHITTNELVRPLAMPGGPDMIADLDDLYRDYHTTALVQGRQCTYCSEKALGASTYPQDQIPWKKWAGQIIGMNPPVRSGPPYVDIVLKEITPQGQDPYGDSLEERILLSQKLKSMGFYRPTRSFVGIPICLGDECRQKSKQDIKAFFKDQGYGPELPLFLQPFTTALGNPVCQICGSEKTRMCKKDDRYCGFGYCGKDHQILDWPNHKEACKYYRKQNKPPITNMAPLICHIFIGDPEKQVKYWVATNSVDKRLLDTESKYHFDNFPGFTRILDDTQLSTLDGTEDGPLPCAVCLHRPAATSGSFHSISVGPDDDGTNKLKYYRSMLRVYSNAGAFQGKPFKDTWELFNDLRSSMAQMAALYIPVCKESTCLSKTTAMHQKFVSKCCASDEEILEPVLYLTQIFPE